MKTLIQGGNVVLKDRIEKCDVLIEDGIITGIGSGLEGDEVILASGKTVIPGIIDRASKARKTSPRVRSRQWLAASRRCAACPIPTPSATMQSS